MEILLSGQAAAVVRMDLRAHLMKEIPEPDSGLADVIHAIAAGTLTIAGRLRRWGLNELDGMTGRQNVHGEMVTQMDAYAHSELLNACRACKRVSKLVSEEADRAKEFSAPGGFHVYIDPLDGSSNVEVCVPVGTIFSIYDAQSTAATGRAQVAAGYAVYGSSTQFVYTAGRGVHAFTLDPDTGSYVRYAAHIRMPQFGGIYSVNQAYEPGFQPEYRAYLDLLRAGLGGRAFSLRYVGSLVSDFHRTLFKGGVFLYPGKKLRLAYEANPLAWIAEEAGGMATDGERPILDVPAKAIHQKTPFLFGSTEEMTALAEVLRRYR